MEETNRFLILTLNGESFAITITSLIEITVPRKVQKDPNLSDLFEGKIEYRGKVIPVVNLKKVLKLPGTGGVSGSLIVVKTAKGPVGVLVDMAQELMTSTQQPVPVPHGTMNPGQSFYAGVLRNREDLVLLLNEDGFLP